MCLVGWVCFLSENEKNQQKRLQFQPERAENKAG
jgi:hypothetical protein